MKTYERKLMSKNGLIIVSLVREFLSFQEGQRVPTITQYVERYGAARGTIQSALRFLSESGAMEFQARGHLGTYVIKIDYQKLWKISGLGSILGLMPLPYTKRYEGMATGLYEAFRSAGLPFNLAYMRGAAPRLEMLEKGIYHFAIISKLAALNIQNTGRRFKIIHEFSVESYVTKHGVILRRGLDKIRDGMKIALDESSPDQTLLTQKECQGINVTYVPMSYNQILSQLEAGQVDAAVWTLDELREKNLAFAQIPLQNEEAKALDRDGTKAVMVIDFANTYIGDVLNQLIDFQLIEELQRQVVEQNKIPMY